MKLLPITRRRFVINSALSASGLLAGCGHKRSGVTSGGDKLNLGFIGAGGRAEDNLAKLADQNIVALCDVDDKNAAKSFEKYPKAKQYRDFRKMLEQEK